MAYKKNVDDSRESPGLRLMELLHARKADVAYYDPYIPVIPPTREHPSLAGLRSISWDPQTLARYDAAIIVTDHDKIDYDLLAEVCPLVLDTRNAMRNVKKHADRIVKA